MTNFKEHGWAKESKIKGTSSIEKMKRHKAAGPNEITTEMITSLEEYEVSKVQISSMKFLMLVKYQKISADQSS